MVNYSNIKINKEIAKVQNPIQEKIDKSASTTQNVLDRKLAELQNDFRNHLENINRLREDFGNRTPPVNENDINQMINECVTQKLEERSNLEEKQSDYTWTATAKQKDTRAKDKPVHMEKRNGLMTRKHLTIFMTTGVVSEHASWNKSADNKSEHLITGDSIIQNISSDKFHKGRKTKISTQRGKGIDNVIDYLHETELDPKNLINHTGSNDIANMDIDNLKEKFESLFDIIIKKFKNSKVYISVPINHYGNLIEMYLLWVHSSKRSVFNMEPLLCSTTILIKMQLVSEAITYTYEIKQMVEEVPKPKEISQNN